MTTTTRLPTFFISHGGPTLLEDKAKPGKFYDWFGKVIRDEIKPKAVVIVSAHWQGQGEGVFGKTHTCSRSPMFVSNAQTTTVEASEGPLKLIYDFYGFPPHYYKQTWNGTGLPSLSHQVADLLQKVCAEIKACSL